MLSIFGPAYHFPYLPVRRTALGMHNYGEIEYGGFCWKCMCLSGTSGVILRFEMCIHQFQNDPMVQKVSLRTVPMWYRRYNSHSIQ